MRIEVPDQMRYNDVRSDVVAANAPCDGLIENLRKPKRDWCEHARVLVGAYTGLIIAQLLCLVVFAEHREQFNNIRVLSTKMSKYTLD